ncbi:integrase-like protein, partial [Chitinophaga skermanii]
PSAAAHIESIITIYNEQRPHSSCNYLTPAQAHHQHGKMAMRWQQKGASPTGAQGRLSTNPGGL